VRATGPLSEAPAGPPSEPATEPAWLGSFELADPAVVAEVVRVVQAVVAAGGAVGWLAAPSADEVLDWLGGAMAAGTRAVVVRVRGRIEALGTWQRREGAVVARIGVVRRVMAHPDARGLGLGALVVHALVADARAAGVEVLTLACRGNNHAALALYAAAGFTEYGRLQDALAVEEHRFDEVLLSKRLLRPKGAQFHGSSATGPGGSTRRVAPGENAP